MGSLELVDVFLGTELGVMLSVFGVVRLAAGLIHGTVLGHGEPELFGFVEHTQSVEHAVVGHQALEAVGLSLDPVHHVASVAGAQRTRPFDVDPVEFPEIRH